MRESSIFRFTIGCKSSSRRIIVLLAVTRTTANNGGWGSCRKNRIFSSQVSRLGHLAASSPSRTRTFLWPAAVNPVPWRQRRDNAAEEVTGGYLSSGMVTVMRMMNLRSMVLDVGHYLPVSGRSIPCDNRPLVIKNHSVLQVNRQKQPWVKISLKVLHGCYWRTCSSWNGCRNRAAWYLPGPTARWIEFQKTRLLLAGEGK